MSATGVPASTCRKARAICSTLNRLVRIGLCLPGSVREPSAQPATYRFLLVLGGPTIREPRQAALGTDLVARYTALQAPTSAVAHAVPHDVQFVSAEQIRDRFFGGTVSVDWILYNVPGKRKYGHRTVRWILHEVEEWLLKHGK